MVEWLLLRADPTQSSGWGTLKPIKIDSFDIFLIIEDIAIHSNIFIGVTSVLSRHGSFTIFLLLTDSSHETHFSTRQNMETEDFFEKKIKFFSPRVLQIFDSKHGSPENYSDFFFKLKNFVFELNGFASVPLRFGSRKIFLLLNDSSHDHHFSACQNIETLDRTQKISNFFLHRFSR